MATPLHFKILTLENTVYESDIEQVTIPTQDGEVTVLARHTPLVSLLKPGQLRLKKDGEELLMSVSGGFIEVRPDSKVVILADTAERADEIDLERAEAGRKRAEAMLQEKESIDNIEFARLQAILEKELARIKVGKKYRSLNGR